LGGFGNGHEETLHALVGDGNRTAILNLLSKDRHHTSGRAQHVSKADCNEMTFRTRGQRLHIQFGNAFVGPHDVRGIHCFIRGDHHKRTNFEFLSQICQTFGCEGNILDGLARVAFHQRYMFVGSGMEDHGGPEFLEISVHPVLVADAFGIIDVRDHHIKPTGVSQFVQFAFQIKLAVLGTVNQNQFTG